MRPDIVVHQPSRYLNRIGQSFRLGLCVVATLVLPALPCAGAAELKPTDFALMDRLTFGVTPSSAEHLRTIGADAWIEEQLHPLVSRGLPALAQSQIEAMPEVHKFPFDIAA